MENLEKQCIGKIIYKSEIIVAWKIEIAFHPNHV